MASKNCSSKDKNYLFYFLSERFSDLPERFRGGTRIKCGLPSQTPTTSVYLRTQHNLATIQNGRQQQPGSILVLRANLRRQPSLSSSHHHLYPQLSNRKPIPGFNIGGRNRSPEPKGREEEFEYDDENQREEMEDREQTPSLSPSGSLFSETISEPETPPDSQSIPLPLPSTERNHSSRSSTPVSSSTSETRSPSEPFRRSRAQSLSSYVPTREGTPQREEGPQESLEGIEEGEDEEELEENEENEGHESGGR
jgi:hypothetical protein